MRLYFYGLVDVIVKKVDYKFKFEPEIWLHCTKVDTLTDDDEETIENRHK